jgi:hypothetical protein
METNCLTSTSLKTAVLMVMALVLMAQSMIPSALITYQHI